MSLHANKKKIALFVAGAVVFGMVMFYSFGGYRLLRPHETFTMFFANSVSGLQRGALVKFKGVPIGYVSDIRLDQQEQPGDQPVIVQVRLDIRRLHDNLGVSEDLADPQVRQRIVDRGLRAQLLVDKWVTGSLYVNLSYYPKPPPLQPYEVGENVIPTVRSDSLDGIQDFEKTMQWLPTYDFAGEASRISNVIDNAAMRVQIIPFAEYSERVVKALEPLSEMRTAQWRFSFGNFSNRLDRTNEVLANTDGQVLRQSKEFITLVSSVGENLAEFNNSLADIRGGVNPRSPWHADFARTLSDISERSKELTKQINAYEAQPGIFNPRGKAAPPPVDSPAAQP